MLMAAPPLLNPSDCAVVPVDIQAGLAFAAGSADRQGIRNAALALAKTAVAFSVPVIVSTSASKVNSGPLIPLIPPLRAVLTNVTPIERRNMNLWEDESAKAAVVERIVAPEG
jgi:nicotinamidase-related amidase